MGVGGGGGGGDSQHPLPWLVIGDGAGRVPKPQLFNALSLQVLPGKLLVSCCQVASRPNRVPSLCPKTTPQWGGGATLQGPTPQAQDIPKPHHRGWGMESLFPLRGGREVAVELWVYGLTSATVKTQGISPRTQNRGLAFASFPSLCKVEATDKLHYNGHRFLEFPLALQGFCPFRVQISSHAFFDPCPLMLLSLGFRV